MRRIPLGPGVDGWVCRRVERIRVVLLTDGVGVALLRSREGSLWAGKLAT